MNSGPEKLPEFLNVVNTVYDFCIAVLNAEINKGFLRCSQAYVVRFFIQLCGFSMQCLRVVGFQPCQLRTKISLKFFFILDCTWGNP